MYFYTIITNYNEPSSADLARIYDARHIATESCHIAEIDQYQIVVCTADDISEVGVDISSIGI